MSVIGMSGFEMLYEYKFRASMVLATVVVPAPRVYIKIGNGHTTFSNLGRRQVVTTNNKTGHPCHVFGMSRC